MRDRRAAIAAALDAAAVVLFVAIGRRNHDEDPGLAGTFETAAPFLIALAVGWLVARAWRRPFGVVTGVVVWVVTIVLGMALRNVVFDRGTASSFIVVASVVTGALLIGWRLVARGITRRRAV